MDEETNGRAPYILIRDLPETDRPRERLRDAGASALSNAELLAILLRVGSSKESALAQATRLLSRFDGLPGMARASFGELCAEHGLGEAKAAQIKAALEMGIRVAASSPEQRPVVKSPEDLAGLMLTEMSLLDQESVRVILLDTRNHVLAIQEVYRGSVHTAQVRIAELLREAVRINAPTLVLAHNHPSGDPHPSAADVAMTRSLHEASKLMDIDLADHMILAGGKYASMRRLGLGFPKDGASR